PEHGTDEWRSTLVTFDINYHYERSIENGLDPAHNEYVHPTHGYQGEREDTYLMTELRPHQENPWGHGFLSTFDAPPLKNPIMRFFKKEGGKMEAGSGTYGPNHMWTYIRFTAKTANKHITQKIYHQKSLSIPSFMSLMMSDSTQIRESVYLPFLPMKEKHDREIWGCNWGVYKQHVLDINGFDEDYVLPCFGEDLDIDWRLSALGLKRYSLKNKAIQYHLHHTQIWDAEIESQGRTIYDAKRSDGLLSCKNGIDKF
ncbi:MAG: hypothetical protein ACO30M_06570, partial [Candidatus Kapaibacteriota bacterium]